LITFTAYPEASRTALPRRAAPRRDKNPPIIHHLELPAMNPCGRAIGRSLQPCTVIEKPPAQPPRHGPQWAHYRGVPVRAQLATTAGTPFAIFTNATISGYQFDIGSMR
jgi:hypothetical protein